MASSFVPLHTLESGQLYKIAFIDPYYADADQIFRVIGDSSQNPDRIRSEKTWVTGFVSHSRSMTVVVVTSTEVGDESHGY